MSRFSSSSKTHLRKSAGHKRCLDLRFWYKGKSGHKVWLKVVEGFRLCQPNVGRGCVIFYPCEFCLQKVLLTFIICLFLCMSITITGIGTYDKPLITVHGQNPRAKSYQAVAIFFLVRQEMHRGCSSVVERMLCMYEAPGSIPGISMYVLGHGLLGEVKIVCSGCLNWILLG